MGGLLDFEFVYSPASGADDDAVADDDWGALEVVANLA